MFSPPHKKFPPTIQELLIFPHQKKVSPTIQEMLILPTPSGFLRSPQASSSCSSIHWVFPASGVNMCPYCRACVEITLQELLEVCLVFEHSEICCLNLTYLIYSDRTAVASILNTVGHILLHYYTIAQLTLSIAIAFCFVKKLCGPMWAHWAKITR